MLAFNPGEPQFQNGTRPSQGREKDFLWGRCFLQLPVSSVSSAESPTSVEVSGRMPGQLGTSCSLSKAASQSEVNEHCTGWALPWQWLGSSADRQGSDGVRPLHLSPRAFSSLCLFQTTHIGKIRKLQHGDTSVLGRRAGNQHHVSHYPWLPPEVKHYTDEINLSKLLIIWHSTRSRTTNTDLPKLHLAALHARDSPTKPHV